MPSLSGCLILSNCGNKRFPISKEAFLSSSPLQPLGRSAFCHSLESTNMWRIPITSIIISSASWQRNADAVDAKRLGFTLGNPTYRTYEEYLEDRLSPTGLTLDELKEHGMMPAKHIMPARTTEDIMKVHTPTGKIEFVSTILKACKKEWHEGVPAYHDFRETLPMKEYPLILTTGSRISAYLHVSFIYKSAQEKNSTCFIPSSIRSGLGHI